MGHRPYLSQTFNDPSDRTPFADREIAGHLVEVTRNERMPDGSVEIEVQAIGMHPDYKGEWPPHCRTRATFVTKPSEPGAWTIADVAVGTLLDLAIATMPRQLPADHPVFAKARG